MVIYIYLDSVLDRHRVLLHNYYFGEAESTNTSFPYQFLVKGGGEENKHWPFRNLLCPLKIQRIPCSKKHPEDNSQSLVGGFEALCAWIYQLFDIVVSTVECCSRVINSWLQHAALIFIFQSNHCMKKKEQLCPPEHWLLGAVCLCADHNSDQTCQPVLRNPAGIPLHTPTSLVSPLFALHLSPGPTWPDFPPINTSALHRRPPFLEERHAWRERGGIGSTLKRKCCDTSTPRRGNISHVHTR